MSPQRGREPNENYALMFINNKMDENIVVYVLNGILSYNGSGWMASTHNITDK